MSKPGKLEDGQIYLGDYLLTRIGEHTKPIFGVPGDFNLTFLDLVEDHKDVEWCGCCNELNAAYAADGYARVKQGQSNMEDRLSKKPTQGGVRGLGVILTTFGVGELSAVNGIAGAFSERVPILHIVGVPSIGLQEKGALLHHTLGDGKFNVFEQASSGISAAQAFLKSADGATDEIDRVIRVAIETARPTYLTLPTNLVFAPVSSTPLKTPLIPKYIHHDDRAHLPSGTKLDDEQEEMIEFVTKEIERLWDASKNPVVLVDACALRYGVVHLVQELVDKTKVKYFTTPMGKGGLPEDSSRGFGGVYVGAITNPEVKAAFESADLQISVGSLLSDFNSGEFTHQVKTTQKIELHSDHTVVQYAQYPKISFHTLLPALIKKLKPKPDSEAHSLTPDHVGLSIEIPDGEANEMIKQEAFWPMWGKKFFKENDIIIAETGTSSFGMIDVQLPTGATFISQTLWGSIGYTGGATLGCLMAEKEASFDRRTILFIGDGSLQLTVQEISTMIAKGLKPIIVVLNNDGYGIERAIHGKDRKYNDISHWKWQNLLDFFNGDNVPVRSWLANTRKEFEEILADEEFRKADRCQLLEVKMGRLDCPRILVEQAKLSADMNTA